MGSGEGIQVQTSAFAVDVPTGWISTLKEHLGKDVIFGIRPEDIHDERFTPVDVTAARLTARVDVIEPMGSERYLYLVADGKDFAARVDPRSAATVGEELDIVLNMDNMHLFDAATEQALL
jgi:multiple sugar transport system ATP-binding protein